MAYRTALLAPVLALGLALPAMAQTTAPSAPVPSAPSTSAPATSAPAQSTPAPALNQGMAGDVFYRETWAPTHWRSSEAIGQSVYNKANERIGEIDELLIDKSGKILAAVVGVGGFLGMGEHKVAVSFSSFEMAREANGKPRLVVNIDKAALKDAPVYKPVDAASRS